MSPDIVSPIICGLHLLLNSTNGLVSDVRRANLVLEDTLTNYVDHVEESIRRHDGYMDELSARVDDTDSVEEVEALLWHMADVYPQYQHLQARLATAKDQVESFLHIFPDPVPTEAHKQAYKRLRIALGSYIGH